MLCLPTYTERYNQPSDNSISRQDADVREIKTDAGKNFSLR